MITRSVRVGLMVSGIALMASLPAAGVPVPKDGAKPPDVEVRPAPDYRSARDQLADRLADIESAVARLDKGGKKEEAVALGDELVVIRGWIRGPYQPPKSDQPEVHVVGLYEGEYPPGVRHMGNFHPQGAAAVKVTDIARPVILVLCSYEPVKWQVDVAPGVKLDSVVVSGYYAQEVAGLPEKTRVGMHIQADGSPDYFFAYRKTELDSYPRMEAKVKALTEREPASFLGTYAYKGTPFVVGPENEEWRLQHVLLRTADLHRRATRHARAELLARMWQLRFKAIHFVPKERFGEAGAVGAFTPLGPFSDTLTPLPDSVKQVAFDSKGTCYGLGGHEVEQIDLARAEHGKLEMDANLPQLSWPSALAFDSKRGRLLLSSFGGGGHLYAYDPAQKSWSVLAKPGLGVGSLAYAADDDVLYGTELAIGSEGFISAIAQFNPDGARLKQIKLSRPIQAPDRIGRCQIAVVNKHLVILVAPTSRPRDWNTPFETYAYVVEAATGKVLFSSLLEPRKEEKAK